MNKNYLLLFSLLLFNFSFSQCLISGPSTINVGDTVVFSVPTGTAQCTECYDWDVSNSSVASIVGSDQNNTVSIQALTAGSFILQLTYFDETGCHTCSVEVNCIIVPNCCTPTLSGFYECRPNGTGGGTMVFESPSNCEVDWSKISSISVLLNGGTFTTSPYSGQSSITLNGPFSGSFNLSFSGQNCTGGSSVGVVADIYFNNGCSHVQIFENFFDQGTPFENADKKIQVYPNPSKSEINFKGKNLSEYRLDLYNSKGDVILKNVKIEKAISIEKEKNGLYYYILKNENGEKQDGKIIKE
ncbi:T9SS type A sorting domain-containing protein [Flavobacterium sp. J27]|uniref:T9SS type A sorting domain-containing protein n=1 Tax=Flavobacterium sp. J27 TaxID=2060419 RepID=UPI00102F69FF|nr:T9SS type A sorting domain-containing protein [Flavobacterium sp. J27]